MLKTSEDGKVIDETTDSSEPTNIYAYLIKNGLLNQQKRKRGDPIDSVIVRRDFS